MLIDTHCHLTFDGLREQIRPVLTRAQEAGVDRVITVATDIADARRAMELLHAEPNVFLAAGIHPHEAAKAGPDDLAALADLHRGQWRKAGDSPRLVAIGETGLDFHYDFATPDQQESLFRYQLGLACELGRPVIIHAREAEDRVCDILADYPRLAGRVVFHCFSGTTGIAERILDMGFLLSFTGVVTFRNADAIREVAKAVPIDRLMVETDAPFMTPEPIRKVRPCEPAFVAHTARFLADLRNEPLERFAAATTRNAERFFRLVENDT